MMRTILKRIISLFLVPATRWYLRRKRSYTYNGVDIVVLPGVFHPGLFYSTKFLLGFLKEQSLANTSLLELGCGSGLISVMSARAGAKVTAVDLSRAAVKNTQTNAALAGVELEIIHSDLFSRLGERAFDWIVVNPPYYANVVQNEAQLAWHCGEDFEYFSRLFVTLGDHCHTGTRVLMVLSQDCALNRIFTIASQHGFKFLLLREKDVWLDGKNFIYEIKPVVKK
jgi:release factor glutamine methyltransferase